MACIIENKPVETSVSHWKAIFTAGAFNAKLLRSVWSIQLLQKNAFWNWNHEDRILRIQLTEKPFMGTLDVPVTNCSSLCLISSPKERTIRQNQRITWKKRLQTVLRKVCSRPYLRVGSFCKWCCPSSPSHWSSQFHRAKARDLLHQTGKLRQRGWRRGSRCKETKGDFTIFDSFFTRFLPSESIHLVLHSGHEPWKRNFHNSL